MEEKFTPFVENFGYMFGNTEFQNYTCGKCGRLVKPNQKRCGNDFLTQQNGCNSLIDWGKIKTTGVHHESPAKQ